MSLLYTIGNADETLFTNIYATAMKKGTSVRIKFAKPGIMGYNLHKYSCLSLSNHMINLQKK